MNGGGETSEPKRVQVCGAEALDEGVRLKAWEDLYRLLTQGAIELSEDEAIRVAWGE